MTAEEAIKTALEYENKVHRTYLEAAGNAHHTEAKRFFELMAEEEKGHVDYLQEKLDQWKLEGRIDSSQLKTALPSVGRITEGLHQMENKLNKSSSPSAFDAEIASLHKALSAEEETSSFYEEMVSELKDDVQGLFTRFLEIEKGHKAMVEAEIDSVENNGFWYDIQEFNQELD